MTSAAGEEEIARYRCLGDDGSPLTVIALCHFSTSYTASGLRRYPGARRLALSTGEPVRYVDATTFEVIGTGELVRSVERT